MRRENANDRQPLIRPINRQQMSWQAMDVEQLIPEDHLARAIWKLVGGLDRRGKWRGGVSMIRPSSG